MNQEDEEDISDHDEQVNVVYLDDEVLEVLDQEGDN